MKIDRLVSIIMLLLEKERISAQELSEMFEVSLRTIYRDLDAINMAGIPIQATSGVGGGFEILPQYKIDKKVFSSDELSSILMGLSSLSSVVHGDELAHALAKVKSFIPEEKSNDITLKANQICVDFSPWTGNSYIQSYVEIIKTAIEEHKTLSFEYVSQSGNKTLRTVEPYQLVLKSGHWYVQTFCLTRNDYRLFRLNRMCSLFKTDKTFEPRDFKNPLLDFSDFENDKLIKIKLRVHNSILDRILDFCSFENIKPDGNNGEYFFADFPFVESDYFYDILLGFGASCECVAPSNVRSEMKKRIQKMGEMYEV